MSLDLSAVLPKDWDNCPDLLACWQSVVSGNEYRLPDRYPRGCIAIDIGANIGAATTALLHRGMDRVLAVDPWKQNCDRVTINAGPAAERVTTIAAAAWSPGSKGAKRPLYVCPDDPRKTCHSDSVRARGEATWIPQTSLDDLITVAERYGYPRVRLVKIDAEAAEYPVLFGATKLAQVDEIIGEWHVFPGMDLSPFTSTAFTCDEFGLKGLLERQGFVVEMGPTIVPEHTGGTRLGLFWARRK